MNIYIYAFQKLEIVHYSCQLNDHDVTVGNTVGSRDRILAPESMECVFERDHESSVKTKTWIMIIVGTYPGQKDIPEGKCSKQKWNRHS